MQKLTVIIPCKNESHNMDDVLQTVQWADEILVVDSFSTDDTLAIARKYTDRILEHEYKNSAAQKNWAIPRATHEWILLVDADERVSQELQDEIKELLGGEPKHNAYWMKRDNYFMGKHVKYGGMVGDRVIRLFTKSARYEERNVHAEIMIDGSVGELKGKLKHNSYKDLGHYVDKINRYTKWSAMDKDAATGRIGLFHILIKPGFKFFQFYILKRGFLDGFVGLVLASLSAYTILLRYIQMWELRRTKEL
ncbi:MAG: glycosyltransferase family 2 protein [Flavobacteriales bacterium]|nr:glycosyltransferase family 2 protein [Flavobacteriales bacterium]